MSRKGLLRTGCVTMSRTSFQTMTAHVIRPVVVKNPGRMHVLKLPALRENTRTKRYSDFNTRLPAHLAHVRQLGGIELGEVPPGAAPQPIR